MMVNLDKKNIIWLFTFIIICLIFGNGLGGYFTFISVEGWYQTLNKPNFNPPDWVEIRGRPQAIDCPLYTSDAADEGLGVGRGGRRTHHKKINTTQNRTPLLS